jgi:hypothetical protein
MSFRVFIPFIHDSFNENDVKSYLESSGLCKVVSIDLHEKKEKTDSGTLRSLNHYYAFLEVIPNLDTQRGKLFQENLKKNYHTKIIHDEDASIYWTLKPHLSVADRNERGISLLPTTTIEIDQIISDEDDNNIEMEIQEEEEYVCPEWELSDCRNMDLSRLSPIPREETSQLPDCLSFLNDSIMKEIAQVANERRLTYLQTLETREEMEKDYNSIETDLRNMHRLMQMIL